jgi:hypothetical protein
MGREEVGEVYRGRSVPVRRGRFFLLEKRTFVRLRRLLASHAELAQRLEALEQKYDAQFGWSSTPSGR